VDRQSRPRDLPATHIAVKTTVSNENNTRLESKMDLILTQIATLSNQLDQKITTLRQEVADSCRKITDELTADAENREKHLEAKLQVAITNANSQYEAIKSGFKSRIKMIDEKIKSQDEYIKIWVEANLKSIETVKELELLTDDMNEVRYESLIEMTKGAQTSTTDNLERIRKRCRIYDANFRAIGTKLKLNLSTIYDPDEPYKST